MIKKFCKIEQQYNIYNFILKKLKRHDFKRV